MNQASLDALAQLRADLRTRPEWQLDIVDTFQFMTDVRLRVAGRMWNWRVPQEAFRGASRDIIVNAVTYHFAPVARQYGIDVANAVQEAYRIYQRDRSSMATVRGIGGRYVPRIEIDGTPIEGVTSLDVRRDMMPVYSVFRDAAVGYHQGLPEVTLEFTETPQTARLIEQLRQSNRVRGFEYQATYDGPVMYRVDLYPQEVVARADGTGLTTYNIILERPQPTVHFETRNIGPSVSTVKSNQAKQRAEKLLRRHLTRYQKRTWKKRQYISVVVTNPQSGTPERYHILDSNCYRVGLNGQKRKANYCIVPNVAFNVQSGDKVLAKLLLLKTDYQAFMKTAIKTDMERRHRAIVEDLVAMYN